MVLLLICALKLFYFFILIFHFSGSFVNVALSAIKWVLKIHKPNGLAQQSSQVLIWLRH